MTAATDCLIAAGFMFTGAGWLAGRHRARFARWRASWESCDPMGGAGAQ